MVEDLLEEKEFAASNLARLSSLIPKRLAGREDKIGVQLAKTKTSPERKLEALYALMDELYQVVMPITPCRKGCSLCCHYAVSVSEIEIAHIEKHAKRKRLKKLVPKADFHGTACPFLENGSCSIYRARPYVCRRHVALTRSNYWCDPVRSNEEEFSLLKFTGFEEAFEAIRKESKSYESVDMRQVFLR